MLAFNASCLPFFSSAMANTIDGKVLNFITEDCLLFLITFNKIFINRYR